MDQKSCITHYRILQSLKDISHALYLSESSDIQFRMKWDVLETDTNNYCLFFTKPTAALQLVRIDKEKKVGHTIAKVEVAKNYYGSNKNNMYRGGTGFAFNGTDRTLNYSEPYKNTLVELECLPVESVRSLILEDSMEELKFQYETLHDFSGDSFEMYCIFSLLHNIDDIAEPIKDGTINRVSFTEVVLDEDVYKLKEELTVLKEKLTKDLAA